LEEDNIVALGEAIYSFVDFFLETGVFGVYFATEKKKLEKSFEVVRKELLNMKKNPVKKNELNMNEIF